MAEDPAARFRLPTGDADLIEFLDKRWKDGVEFRRAADIQAFWNIAFYRGFQWLYEDTRSESSLRRLPVDAEDPDAPVMLTVNKIASRVDRAVAEITGQSPGVEARPVSDEDDDVDAAKVATRISSHEDRRMSLETLLPRLYTWVVPAGWAYLQLTWNSEDGRAVGDDPNPDLAKEGIVRSLREGNCQAHIRPHFEVVQDPMSTDSWEARWVMTQAAMTPEEIWQQYDKVVEKPTHVRVISDELGALATEKGLHKQERIAVRQFWLRPGMDRSYPKGMCFTWAGHTVLERKDWPYTKTSRHGLIQFNYLPPQGGYFGRTPVSDLIDLQVDYNRARSLEADLSSRLLPKGFYQEGSMSPDETSARLEWVPVLPGAEYPRVDFMGDGSWMQSHETIQNRANDEMDERMSQPEAARGGLAGTSPAAGVMAQQEQARKPYSIPAKEQARSLSRFGWQRLMLVRQYWREERLVRTWSRAGTLTVERFTKADLDRELDVEVRAESILPRSKAAQAQLAVQLLQSQVPGFDIRHFIRMIDLPGTDIISELYDADERHAERENQYLAVKGRKVPNPPREQSEEAQAKWVAQVSKIIPWVMPRDNHEVHIETHRLHMISHEFEKYPDKVKALFEAHQQQHEFYLAERQRKAQEAQMAAQQQEAQMQPGPGPGGPGGNGAAPGLEEMAGIGGGPGGGRMEPGVPPGIPPEVAAELMGR